MKTNIKKLLKKRMRLEILSLQAQTLNITLIDFEVMTLFGTRVNFIVLMENTGRSTKMVLK